MMYSPMQRQYIGMFENMLRIEERIVFSHYAGPGEMHLLRYSMSGCLNELRDLGLEDVARGMMVHRRNLYRFSEADLDG